MKHYNIVCICQIFNELHKDNLERFVNYILPLVSDLVVYDDSSTDGSYEYMLSQTPHVIRGTKNDFANERSHKQLLLQEALTLKPDFILWLDADEVLTANAKDHLQNLCQVCVEGQFDAVKFHELNLWRSHSWRRLDSLFDTGWFCRLWRVVPGICFNETKPGLHQQLFPSTIVTTALAQDVKVLHYGFSSKQRLAHKYLVYKSHGQRGYDMLDRLISEEQLVVEKVPQEFFPEGLWIDDDEPIPLTFAESLAYVEEYREEVFKPKFTIVCLIYKSVEWLKFVYEQVFKYTDMTDKEFFFVANDANPAVLSYLKDNYIPHYVFTNTPQHQEEWFINNVYRAYNFAVSKVQGDFIVFINSDMAFTPGWFESLWKAYDGSNCISSRLVESGKLHSGQFGLENNFGWDYASYQEEEFQQYARTLAEPKIEDGGLFMPLLIRKEHFEQVGGYPEGNIVLGSEIDQLVMARHGEACISGDNVLMLKLQAREIKHQTAFDSLVYHFQCGELDSPETAENKPTKLEVAICNDLGISQELMIAETTNKKKVKQHKVSIIITTFQRAHLLRWGLYSLSQQTMPFEFETIVVNDGLQDETEEICNEFKEKLNLKYIFTGQRNLEGDPVWRVPGFAINIGVKQSSGDILVMCCAEMFHVNDTIARLTKPILDNSKLLGIPVGKDDRDGDLLESITKNNGTFDAATYNNCVDLYSKMPFLMALHRRQFIEIGGYDEDLVGIAYDDRDIIDRLLGSGCNYCLTDAETAHLYHPRADGYYEGGGPPEWDYNRNLYFSRIGKIVRNEGREWGILTGSVKCEEDRLMEQDFKPKVSIIMPVFNGSNYMQEAIDSALAQTYTNIEVIVINDGSNDNGATDNIALLYGDRIRYFSKENGGVASALNLGIEKMTGEYFSWLSHDDIYFPKKIEIQIEILQKTKLEEAILYGGYELIDEHLKVFAQVKPDALYTEEKLNIPLFPILRGLINGCCLLIHKNHFERVGLFDEKLSTTQDYALWFRMFRDAKLIYHKEILVKSRFHPEQSSKKIPNHISECNQLWSSFLDQITQGEMCEMEGSQYMFYKKTAEFLQINTPYTLAQHHATILAERAMEKISVIIPFFNRSKLLLEAVNSVLDQTYGNFEVLLIDDGSTEDLTSVKDIIKRDSRVQYVYQEHKGASAARNLGISLAIGSYVAFLDSDDIFAPQKLEKQISFMQTNGFSFSHTSYQRMDNDGNLMEVINSGIFSGELFPSILAGCCIASPTVIIKKELLENRRFKEDIEIGEDICLWIDIAYYYPIGGIQEPLSKVRVDSSSAALNARKQQIGLMNIANHIIKNPLYVVHEYFVYLLLTKLLYLFSQNH